MARVQMSFLGGFEVRLEGQPVTAFESHKARALLAYLAVEAERAHSRGALAGLLWPDWPERSARSNLTNVLAHLRTILHDREAPSPCLLVEREAAQLNLQGDCWVDVAAFSRLVKASQPRYAAGTAAAEATAQGLEEAAALYRGRFLEGFSLCDSPPFEQWVLAVQERLQRQAMEALSLLAGHYEGCGEWERAIHTARRQLELEAWYEQAHRQLMRLLAHSGQRSVALAQYEACQRALKQELDVEPSAETIALYQRIRDGVLRQEGPSVQPTTAPTAPPAPVKLPAWLAPFVGREDLLAQIQTYLQDPSCRLLTLVGPGGSGKTRLAVEAAAREAGRYPHGVFFVPLAPLQSIESVVPTVAQTLGLVFDDQETPRQQLLDYLRQKQALLLLDNYEHLLAGVSLVTDILHAAPGVKAVVTSRVALSVRGEQLMPVPGMSFPAQLPAASEQVLQYSAVQLFLQGARRLRPGFQPTAEEMAQVAQVCRRVEGMPLALLLAAAWMRVLSPAEIAARLAEQSLDFLEAAWRDAPERQRSMRTVCDHSWRLLSEREREAFAALSVFRGGFAEHAARHAAGATLHELAGLIDCSLVHRTPDGRYEVHELLRQYGEERLGESPDGGQAARDRHAAYYMAALERWTAEMKGPRQQTALAEVNAEIGNVCAAWEWAAACGQAERLAQGLEGLGWFYAWHTRFEEGETLFQTAANGLAAVGCALPAAPVAARRTLARLWSFRGLLGAQLGHAKEVEDLLRQSQKLLEGLESAGCDVRPERAFCAYVAGGMEMWSGHPKESTRLLEQSVALYRALGARWEMAAALQLLGNVLHQMDLYGQAEQAHREALAIRREVGDPRGIAESLPWLSWLLLEQGELVEAEGLRQEFLSLCQSMGAIPLVEDKPAVLSAVLCWQGRFAEARSLAEECVATFQAQGIRFRLGVVTQELCGIDTHLGRYAEAWREAQAGLAMAQESGYQLLVGAYHFRLGSVAAVQGDYAEASRQLQEGLALFQVTESRAMPIMVLAALGGVAMLQGRVDQARQHLSHALQRLTGCRSFIALLFAMPFAARLLAEQGEAERAVEVYALASRYPYVSNSQWYRDLVGCFMEDIAASLPPEVTEAARKRGRARDPWATVHELLAELERDL